MSRPTATDLLGPARRARESVDQFPPMVTFASQSGTYVAVLAFAGEDEDDAPSMTEMLFPMLQEMRTQLGPADWIAVTADAYIKNMDSPDDVLDKDLSEAFADGDMEVFEQIIVTLIDSDAEIEAAAQTYRHLPSEGWEWGNPTQVDGVSGGVVEILKQFI